MRAAIYARFSSDLQNEKSIADQVAEASAYAERHGHQVVAVFTDAAISGSTTVNRPGIIALKSAALARQFDVVITESLDRLSRDQGDLGHLYRDLGYAGVPIVTIADEQVNELHIGLKGTMAALFLKDLAQKTRRGAVGRTKEGRVAAGICYGYEVADIKESRTGRRIKEDEAEIIRRIFREYIETGKSALIAAKLNAEGIPSPRGGTWSGSTITGNVKREAGIINNRLYVGKLVYGRQKMVKNPATGRRETRSVPKSEWVEVDVPELAIVTPEMFEAAQARRRETALGPRPHARRTKHLLSGLIKCAHCNNSMIIVKKDRLACGGHKRGLCNMNGTITISEVVGRVLDPLKNFLLDPEMVEAAVAKAKAAFESARRSRGQNRRRLEREKANIEGRIKGVLRAIETTADSPRALALRLRDLERELDDVDRRLANLEAEMPVLAPNFVDGYRRLVENLQPALREENQEDWKKITLLRSLIKTILVFQGDPKRPETAPERGAGLRLILKGNLAVLLDGKLEADGTTSLVAGGGLEPPT
jgi:site-specific DNA recombinase